MCLGHTRWWPLGAGDRARARGTACPGAPVRRKRRETVSGHRVMAGAGGHAEPPYGQAGAEASASQWKHITECSTTSPFSNR